MPDENEKRPTLRSLAAITGLGVSTVSQALRGSPEIADETRKRVRLAAEAAGYRPNRAGVRLRTGKSNVITLVLNPQDEGSGFFGNIVYGISDALAGSSYHLVVTPYSLSDAMAPIRYIVETNSADGVIISRIQPDDQRVRYMMENNMPFVTHGRTDMSIEHCYFDYDNESYAIKALDLLQKRGRKRIALIGPPPTLTYYRHLQTGFERGLNRLGLSGFTVGPANSDSSIDELHETGRELADRHERPDGIICVSSSSAIALVTGLADRGMKLGVDYDMVAKPMPAPIAMAIPGLIAVDEDFRKAGYELGRMLMAHLQNPSAPKIQMIDAP